MAVRGDPEQLPALLVIAGIGVAFAVLWWGSLSNSERREFMVQIKKQEHVEAPLPRRNRLEESVVWIVLEEFQWLVSHRAAMLQGMALFLLQIVGLVGCEGFYRRRIALMSGFGLGMVTAGRMAGVLWIIMLGIYLLLPVPVPQVVAALVLGGMLSFAVYALTRGMPRVH